MMTTPKISVIITVMNEAKTISLLLHALTAQTLPPDEVVITDGGSSDGTLDVVRQYLNEHPSLDFTIQTAVVRGNRSRGRNTAIHSAKNELIAITDAGCIPATTWLAELVGAYQRAKDPATVVAGYAAGKPQTPFQHAVIPYFLVMPDRIDPSKYLPATRSMLITKQSWERAGKFPEQFNTSEDYIFANQLTAQQIPITFTQQAVVHWQPPSTLGQSAKTFASFAACDLRAGILRPKVVALFARYILGASAVMLLLQLLPLVSVLLLTSLGTVAYLAWSIKKNARYTRGAWYWLPILQLTADVCVMVGSLFGIFQRFQDGSSSA